MRYGNYPIYDIGFHNGDDTAHYLKEGYDVLAVEANPILVDEGKKDLQKPLQIRD